MQCNYTALLQDLASLCKGFYTSVAVYSACIVYSMCIHTCISHLIIIISFV